jgi:hypothetical protein
LADQGEESDEVEAEETVVEAIVVEVGEGTVVGLVGVVKVKNLVGDATSVKDLLVVDGTVGKVLALNVESVVNREEGSKAEGVSGSVEHSVDPVSFLSEGKVSSPANAAETVKVHHLLGGRVPGGDFAGTKGPFLRDSSSDGIREPNIIALDIRRIPIVHHSAVDECDGAGETPHELVRLKREFLLFFFLPVSVSLGGKFLVVTH